MSFMHCKCECAFFLKLHSKGYVPILVEGKRINSTNIDDFKKNTLESFFRQYSSVNQEHLLQLSKDKIVIIIDNFDKVIFNNRYRGKLLSSLLEHYDNVIITGNSLMSFEELLSQEVEEKSILSSFKTYKVREFGHLLRSKFINKWITLGNQETLTDEERIRKLDEVESIIDTVTGKNLVPNYPLFLLTILQAIEIDNPANLTASTFGHYYQFLILKSFGSILKNQHEITSYDNYISALAYYFFENKIREITKSDLKKFDDKYREGYTITHTPDKIVENLCAAKILEESNRSYEFKYQYIYYFFISKYLHENIGKADIKIIISAMIKRVYKSEFANILLFLTHHSNDEFLLNEVITEAKNLFNELDAFKLEPSSRALNNLVKKLPSLTYHVKGVDEHRDEVNTRKDEREEEGESSSDTNFEMQQSADLTEDISKINIIAKLNLSFKMIEVLGQILKNNYGKISNPNLVSLVEETYLLGLRVLNVFFSSIESNFDGIMNQINEIVAERKLKDKKKEEAASKQILFSICSEITYEFIKKISDCLGTQDLEKTYDSVLKQHPYNSVKLIDFAIRLDHFKTFPNNEMKILKADFHKTPLATNIMRRMVLDYIYLFPTKIVQRQRILSFLEISMDAQRKIDFTSTVRKR